MPFSFAAIAARLLGIGHSIRSGIAWLLTHPRALAILGAALLVGLVLLQSSRLSHAKSDLSKARAALVDPTTHRKWQDEAVASARDFGTCRTNTSTLTAALDRQSASLKALQVESARKTAEAEKAASDARKAMAEAEKLRAQIAAPLKAQDIAAKVDEIFKRSRESLK